MLENDVPKTIREQYARDKEEHDVYCDEGYIYTINEFSRDVKERKCPYCVKFNKGIFDD